MQIQIRNLGKKVTTDSLAAVFSTYGNVQSSSFVSAPLTNTVSRTAVVIMPNEQEAAVAIEQLNGRFVDGFIIAVAPAYAQKKPQLLSFYQRVRSYIAK